VYRGFDSRLGRQVAIKVLSEHLARDPQPLARFEREARAVAALSHPNILAIHDFGRDQSVIYAVTELLEGETLRARLRRGVLRWREAVATGISIADGLAAASTKGIIHRDLKPENIFLTSDGRVKILDFGLARVKRAAAIPTATSAPTTTQSGVVMGTVGYMSPEQVRGGKTDTPSDIFSLGCVLYEMVSGRMAFARDTPVQIMTAILEQPPQPLTVSEAIPAEVEHIILRCLVKNPADRIHSAHDLTLALKGVLDGSETRFGNSAPRRPVRNVRWIAAVIVLALVSVAVWWLSRSIRPIDSLAVLPFAHTGAAQDDEYLSDGITDNIIGGLSQLPRLRVMARSTVFRYKGRSVDPQSIGRELKVGAVLTGALIRQGDNLIIRTELVDTGDGARLWGAQYNRKLSDILRLQDDIAQQISEKLRWKLSGVEHKRLRKHYTEDPEAYQLYLKGLFQWNKRTPESVKRGMEFFKQAIEKDPGYALAYAGLSETYAVLIVMQAVSPKDTYPLAKAAAQRAVNLDDELAEGHSALAHVRFRFEWDWRGAEPEFQRAFLSKPKFCHPTSSLFDVLGFAGALRGGDSRGHTCKSTGSAFSGDIRPPRLGVLRGGPIHGGRSAVPKGAGDGPSLRLHASRAR
jgi:serine/threonine-protein kinase